MHVVGIQPSRPMHAIVARPDSDIDRPTQLADQPVAVNFHAGSHFAAIRLLEGYLGKEHLRMQHFGGPAERLNAVMEGEVAAGVVMEPYIALADQLGCRFLCEGFFVATDVANDELDAETLAALYRALGRAVEYLNADPGHKVKYAPYLMADIPADYPWGRPELKWLRPQRQRYEKPGPYPEWEFRLTADLMIRWGLLTPEATYDRVVDNRVAAAT